MQKTTRPAARDPFAALGIPHTATAADARRAFRRLAFDTHPDRGGDPAAFRAAREAADALATAPDVDRERSRWAPPPPASGVRYGPRPEVRYGPRPEVRYWSPGPVPLSPPDPRAYPPCTVTDIGPDILSVPADWIPPEAPPPGGLCIAKSDTGIPGIAGGLPFGVWLIVGVGTVFGPPFRG